MILNLLNNLRCLLFRRKTYGCTLNLNLNLLIKQPRVLLCYLPATSNLDLNRNKVYHPNIYHHNQMIYILSKLGFTIDLCYCNDLSALKKIENRKYDLLIGFGNVYKAMLKKGNVEKSILFITENNPIIVDKNYNDRVDYFKKRRGRNANNIRNYRNIFYDIEQFEISNIAISMNSTYNTASMEHYFKVLYHINVNGLFNSNFKLKKDSYNVADRSNNFVWFGSTGVIHKGLDILVEAFAQMPTKTLNIYGISKHEISIIRPYVRKNIILHEKIDVMSDEFISEVIAKNAFVVSLSCSEGMQSGIATCMLHGLIPIITKETGYEPQNFIFEFQSYSLDDVIKKIADTDQLSEEDINKLSAQVYQYAHKKLTLENFTKEFENIMKKCLESNYL